MSDPAPSQDQNPQAAVKSPVDDAQAAGLAAIAKASQAAQGPVKILTVLENVLNQSTYGNLESQAAIAYLLHKRCEERYLESLSNEAKKAEEAPPPPKVPETPETPPGDAAKAEGAIVQGAGEPKEGGEINV